MLVKPYLDLLRLAFPIILANAAVPILGLVDTAMIGQTGTASDLGAIALASLIFSFVYWGFGFLRMGTTGFIAQAAGARHHQELHALVFRTLFIAVAIGLALILLQQPIGWVATTTLSASNDVNERVQSYFYLRIWGAPATLTTFALLGILIGMGWTRTLLAVQLLLNGLNILFNVIFVLGFGLGVKGIALGTVCAEWITVFFALYWVLKKMGIRYPKARVVALKNRILNRKKLWALVHVNSDIMVRTLALISGFAWFAQQGAQLGDETLAANHLLLQFITLSAFFLDGYANVAEMRAGQAYGAVDKQRFQTEVRRTTVLAAITAALLGAGIYASGSYTIPWLSQDHHVQQLAIQHLPYAALYIVVSFAAFQLDGIFIGATQSRAMRNATVLALAVLIALGTWWSALYGNRGLWVALVVYITIRAVVLAWYYPMLLKRLTPLSPKSLPSYNVKG